MKQVCSFLGGVCVAIGFGWADLGDAQTPDGGLPRPIRPIPGLDGGVSPLPSVQPLDSSGGDVNTTRSPRVMERISQVLSGLHQANQDEIALGNLVRRRGQSERVRTLGTRASQEHGRLDDKARQVARQIDVVLLPSSGEGKEQLRRELERKDGKAFDVAYLQVTISDHEKTILTLRNVRSSVTDRRVSALVEETISVLERHHRSAQAALSLESATMASASWH